MLGVVGVQVEQVLILLSILLPQHKSVL